MKKYRFKFLCLFTLCFICSTSTVCAQTKGEKARTAYNQFIANHSLSSAVIIDLDNNKIPELLCFDKDSFKSLVYTYKPSKKKIVKLCSINSGKGYGSYYNAKKHQVALFSCSTGGSIYKIYKIKGTKAIKKVTYISSRKYPTFNYTYKKNGKKISYKSWNKAVSSITNKWKKFNGIMDY